MGLVGGKYMGLKIGDAFQGKECHNQLIKGTICKILERTVIVENGVEHFVVRKTEFTNAGLELPKYNKAKTFNH